jgi:hypothetical protein
MLLTGFAVLALAQSAAAQNQVYGKWATASDGRRYCEYLYKSTPDARAYKKQYVFFDPRDPHWVYWANPANNPDNKSGKDSYWARCPTKAHPKLGQLIKDGKDVWSILPPDKRVSRFADLNKAAFPEAKVMSPPIPGSMDGRTIDCPPDPPDLPK